MKARIFKKNKTKQNLLSSNANVVVEAYTVPVKKEC